MLERGEAVQIQNWNETHVFDSAERGRILSISIGSQALGHRSKTIVSNWYNIGWRKWASKWSLVAFPHRVSESICHDVEKKREGIRQCWQISDRLGTWFVDQWQNLLTSPTDFSPQSAFFSVRLVFCERWLFVNRDFLSLWIQGSAVLVPVSCQYHIGAIPVPCQCNASITPVSCQGHARVMPVSCQYHMSVSCQYHASIMLVSYQ